MVFWHTIGWPNHGQKIRTYNNQQKKRTSKIVNFAVPADHWVKFLKSEKKDKCMDRARKLKKTVEHESNVYITCSWCS